MTFYRFWLKYRLWYCQSRAEEADVMQDRASADHYWRQVSKYEERLNE